MNPLSLQSVVLAGARQVSRDLAGEAAILDFGFEVWREAVAALPHG